MLFLNLTPEIINNLSMEEGKLDKKELSIQMKANLQNLQKLLTETESELKAHESAGKMLVEKRFRIRVLSAEKEMLTERIKFSNILLEKLQS